MKNYNSKIHWNISGAFSKFRDISSYALKNGMLRKYKKITVYDGIENCVWNGGRLHNGTLYNAQAHKFYQSLGWGINLTLTNAIIEDLSDEKGNWLLETFHEEGNSIILVNEELRKYIRKNFPKYKLIYSITGCGNTEFPFTPKDIAFYKDKQDNFDCIVPRSDHNFDPGLDQLDGDKLELLINEECVFNCPKYMEHFDEVNERNSQDTSNASEEEIVRIHNCKLDCGELEKKAAFDKEMLGDLYPFNLNSKQVLTLIDRGHTNFKLRGRDESQGSFNYFLNKYIIDYDKVAEEVCLR